MAREVTALRWLVRLPTRAAAVTRLTLGRARRRVGTGCSCIGTFSPEPAAIVPMHGDPDFLAALLMNDAKAGGACFVPAQKHEGSNSGTAHVDFIYIELKGTAAQTATVPASRPVIESTRLLVSRSRRDRSPTTPCQQCDSPSLWKRADQGAQSKRRCRMEDLLNTQESLAYLAQQTGGASQWVDLEVR